MKKTYTCAVITPVGPGHEVFVQEALASVETSFDANPGMFSEVIFLRVDDPEGNLGRSLARNIGIMKAAELGIDWLFFLDADDLMAPRAFDYVSPYIQEFDAVWGSIWTVEHGETLPRERPCQLPFLTNIEEILQIDPVITLQMGHFVKTSVAFANQFNETLNTGEDFDYYLRVWEKFRCIKMPLPFFYNRRGFHSTGPRSANGVQWCFAVESVLKEYRKKYGIS